MFSYPPLSPTFNKPTYLNPNHALPLTRGFVPQPNQTLTRAPTRHNAGEQAGFLHGRVAAQAGPVTQADCSVFAACVCRCRSSCPVHSSCCMYFKEPHRKHKVHIPAALSYGTHTRTYSRHPTAPHLTTYHVTSVQNSRPTEHLSTCRRADLLAFILKLL